MTAVTIILKDEGGHEIIRVRLLFYPYHFPHKRPHAIFNNPEDAGTVGENDATSQLTSWSITSSGLTSHHFRKASLHRPPFQQ